MRPLNDRMTISIFRDLNVSAAGLVANEAVASHNDRPSYGRVEVVSADIGDDVSPGDVVMFSRFAGVHLDRSGLKRMISLKEVMAIAEPSDMTAVTIGVADRVCTECTLAPGSVITIEDDRASILGVLAEDVDAIDVIKQRDVTTVSFIAHDGRKVEITASTKNLFSDGQLVARGHKIDGRFWRHVD